MVLPVVATLTACSAVSSPSLRQPHHADGASSTGSTAGRSTPAGDGRTTSGRSRTTSSGGSTTIVRVATPGNAAAARPGGTAALPRNAGLHQAREHGSPPDGSYGERAAGQTLLVPPGGAKRAGIAWMDTGLLSARLYSGSLSPGGGPYRYTAPVTRTAAGTLVAAFNGGFKMTDAHGGYYTEGRTIDPLIRGAASLVIYTNGAVTVGAWGSDVTMTPNVAAVRQNLFPLVVNGTPSPRASTRTWRVWGGTCPCGAGQHGAWTTSGGPALASPRTVPWSTWPARYSTRYQVADLLVRAGAVRGMQLDINPTWPVFASFKPVASRRPGRAVQRQARLIGTDRGPATFFDPAYARDFITMSARPAPGSR